MGGFAGGVLAFDDYIHSYALNLSFEKERLEKKTSLFFKTEVNSDFEKCILLVDHGSDVGAYMVIFISYLFWRDRNNILDRGRGR